MDLELDELELLPTPNDKLELVKVGASWRCCPPHKEKLELVKVGTASARPARRAPGRGSDGSARGGRWSALLLVPRPRGNNLSINNLGCQTGPYKKVSMQGTTSRDNTEGTISGFQPLE